MGNNAPIQHWLNGVAERKLELSPSSMAKIDTLGDAAIGLSVFMTQGQRPGQFFNSLKYCKNSQLRLLLISVGIGTEMIARQTLIYQDQNKNNPNFSKCKFNYKVKRFKKFKYKHLNTFITKII